MKTRILIVLMTFVFGLNLQAQKISRKKVQITGLKNAKLLGTDAHGNVFDNSSILNTSESNALIKGTNEWAGRPLVLKSNKKGSFDFNYIIMKAKQNFALTTKKLNLNSKNINFKSYPKFTDTFKPLSELTDNTFVTKKHLSDNVSSYPDIVGGDNITIDKTNPKKIIISSIGGATVGVPYVGADKEIVLGKQSPIDLKRDEPYYKSHHKITTDYASMKKKNYNGVSVQSHNNIGYGLVSGFEQTQYDVNHPYYMANNWNQANEAVKHYANIDDGEIILYNGLVKKKVMINGSFGEISSYLGTYKINSRLSTLKFLDIGDVLPETSSVNNQIFTDNKIIALRRKQGTVALVHELPEYTTETITNSSIAEPGKMLFDNNFLYLRTNNGWRKVTLTGL